MEFENENNKHLEGNDIKPYPYLKPVDEFPSWLYKYIKANDDTTLAPEFIFGEDEPNYKDKKEQTPKKSPMFA